MQQSMRMCRVESIRDIGQQGDGTTGVERRTAADKRGEWLTTDVLGHEPEPAGVEACILHREHARVLQGPKPPYGLPEVLSYIDLGRYVSRQRGHEAGGASAFVAHDDRVG